MKESFEISSNSINADKNTNKDVNNSNNIFLEVNNLNLLSKTKDLNEFIDDDLYDDETNNIFLLGNNLNLQSEYKIKEDKTVLNLINPPNSFREITIAFSRTNIIQLLKGKITLDDLRAKLRYRGKHKPCINDDEAERIVNCYVKEMSNRLSYYNKDVITSFIELYRENSINQIVSYYIKRPNAKKKDNSNSSSENIIFNFNVDKFREVHFGMPPSDMNFDPHDDRELFILDYVRMYWILYMLLVFVDISNISENDEVTYFEKFHNVISLAILTGIKMRVELEFSRSYGEFYEELKGFKAINPKYLLDGGTKEKQQITFKIINADFLTEAYKKEYQGAIYIDKNIGDTKKDKHIDIELTIMKGTHNNSALIEVTISGQEPLGRIYSAETNPKININMNNMYYYGLPILQPVIYLFRTCLNYCKDLEVKSYYTELQNYLAKYKGKRTRGLIPKLLTIILLAIYEKPNEKELTSFLDKYFKPTDKQQKAEIRKLCKEIQSIISTQKNRFIDEIRRELWKIVW